MLYVGENSQSKSEPRGTCPRRLWSILLVSGILSNLLGAISYIPTTFVPLLLLQQPIYCLAVVSVFGALAVSDRVRNYSTKFHVCALLISLLAWSVFLYFAVIDTQAFTVVWAALSSIFVMVNILQLYNSLKRTPLVEQRCVEDADASVQAQMREDNLL